MTCTCGASRGEALSHDYDCENATPSPMTTPNDATGGHTAVPWKLDERAGCLAVYEASKDYNCLDGITDLFIHYKHGKNIEGTGWWMDPTDIANARLIVLAVNNHAKLVEALRELLERVAPEGRYRSEEIEPYFKEPVAKARALLQSIEKGGAR